MLKYPVGGRHDIVRAAFLKTVKRSRQSLLGLLEREEDIAFLRNTRTYLPISQRNVPSMIHATPFRLQHTADQIP